VSELLKRSEDFYISALEGLMGDEKQREKSWKDVLFLCESRCKKDLHLIPALGTNTIRFKMRAQFSHE